MFKFKHVKKLYQACAFGLLTSLSAYVPAADIAQPPSTNQSGSAALRSIELNGGDEIALHLELGEIVLIEMISNPSTGYRWDATQLTREKRCYLVKEVEMETSRTPTEGQPLAGAPVKQRFTLRHDPDFPCLSEQRVTWTYRRSWEPFNHSDQRASVLLQGLK